MKSSAGFIERLRLTGAHRVEVDIISCDLTEPEGLRLVETRLSQTSRRIDLLINNAGSETQHDSFIDRDRDLLDKEVRLNAIALLRLTHAAAAGMARNGGGHVINVSAGAGFYPVPGSASYGASKAFVNSLTEAVNYELRSSGVKVTAICPGFTRTGAQARLGLRSEIVPPAMWSSPSEVVDAALKAARGPDAVAHVGRINALAAILGQHLPRSWWLPRVARVQRRLKAASGRES